MGLGPGGAGGGAMIELPYGFLPSLLAALIVAAQYRRMRA